MSSPAPVPFSRTGPGITAEHDFRGAAIGQVYLIYQGRQVSPPPGMSHYEIEAEVYRVDGILSVHTVCPKCRHSQWIDGRNKTIEYDAKKGTLHVEPFKCPWEMSEERKEFGFGLCNFTVAYDGKIVKDA